MTRFLASGQGQHNAKSEFLYDHARNTVATSGARIATLLGMNEKAIRRAASARCGAGAAGLAAVARRARRDLDPRFAGIPLSLDDLLLVVSRPAPFPHRFDAGHLAWSRGGAGRVPRDPPPTQ